MNLKKFACTALAGAMVLSMSATAFAAEGDPTEVKEAGGIAETKISGSLQELTISVTVPSTGSVVLNPYKLSVALGEADEDSGEIPVSQDAVINATQFIESNSNVALDVGVTVTGTQAGTAKLATASAEAATTNSVYMYFQMANTDDGETEPEWGAYNADTDVLVAAKATKKDAIVTLDAMVEDSENEGEYLGSYAAFHLAGDMAAAPKTPWTSADKVDVTVAFTFTPVAADVSTGE